MAPPKSSNTWNNICYKCTPAQRFMTLSDLSTHDSVYHGLGGVTRFPRNTTRPGPGTTKAGTSRGVVVHTQTGNTPSSRGGGGNNISSDFQNLKLNDGGASASSGATTTSSETTDSGSVDGKKQSTKDTADSGGKGKSKA